MHTPIIFRLKEIEEIPPNGCDEFFDNTYWEGRDSFPSWSGSFWDLSDSSGTQYLDVIQSGPNDNWEVGYGNDTLKITINVGSEINSDTCYIEVNFSDGSTGLIGHQFTDPDEEFIYDVNISGFSGDIEYISILFFPSGGQTGAQIKQIEFCEIQEQAIEFFDDDYWQSTDYTFNYPIWESVGSQIENDLTPINSGLNVNWEVGFRQSTANITITSGTSGTLPRTMFVGFIQGTNPESPFSGAEFEFTSNAQTHIFSFPIIGGPASDLNYDFTQLYTWWDGVGNDPDWTFDLMTFDAEQTISEHFDNTWWEGDANPSVDFQWNGSKWELQNALVNPSISVIQSGPNDNWEVGFRPNRVEITFTTPSGISGKQLDEINFGNSNALELDDSFASIPVNASTQYTVTVDFRNADDVRYSIDLDADIIQIQLIFNLGGSGTMQGLTVDNIIFYEDV